jgi:hypothetical protein
MIAKPEGKMLKSRPRIKWMDGVEKDLRNLGIVNCRAKAQERDGWRKFLEQRCLLYGFGIWPSQSRMSEFRHIPNYSSHLYHNFCRVSSYFSRDLQDFYRLIISIFMQTGPAGKRKFRFVQIFNYVKETQFRYQPRLFTVRVGRRDFHVQKSL